MNKQRNKYYFIVEKKSIVTHSINKCYKINFNINY